MTLRRIIALTLIVLSSTLSYAQQRTLHIDPATHPYKGSVSINMRDVLRVVESTRPDANAETAAANARYYRPSGDSLVVYMKDGSVRAWHKDDVSEYHYETLPAVEKNYAVLLENDLVHRYLTEVVYDPEDYEYTLIDSYLDRTIVQDEPRPIVISQDKDIAYVEGEQIALYRDKDHKQVIKRQAYDGDSLVIWNTIPGDTLFYAIYDDDATTVLQQGYATGYGQLRMIYAPSVNNIRDMGGWPLAGGGHIRYGRLFRGAKFHDANALYLSREDSIRLRELDIKCEFDLRGGTEAGGGKTINYYSRLGRDIDYRINGHGMYAYVNAVEVYPEYFRYGWNMIKAHVFAGDPIFVHCSHGCDRMGTWALVIEGVLGVEENNLNLDYELSAFAPKTGLWRYRNMHQTIPDYDFRATIAYIKTLPGDTLKDKFEHFLVKKCSIPQADIDRLRECLIVK